MHAERKKKRRASLIILLIIGLVTIATSVWLKLQAGRGPPQLYGASLLPAPRPVEDFHLTDQNNQPLDAQRLRGQWTFAFFGYTNCPDVCPDTLMVLDRVSRILAAQPAQKSRPLVLFISVDPERDTPEKLKTFVRYFNESFLAATGTVEQIEKLSRPLGVIFERGEDSNGNYAINHSSSILLLSPDGALVAKFPSSVETPEDIVSDFRKIRGYYGG